MRCSLISSPLPRICMAQGEDPAPLLTGMFDQADTGILHSAQTTCPVDSIDASLCIDSKPGTALSSRGGATHQPMPPAQADSSTDDSSLANVRLLRPIVTDYPHDLVAVERVE